MTIDEVLSKFTLSDEDRSNLKTALLEREDTIRDQLTSAAANLGAFPDLAAEVFCEVGLGTEPDEVTREFIRQQAIARIQWLNQQFGNQ